MHRDSLGVWAIAAGDRSPAGTVTIYRQPGASTAAHQFMCVVTCAAWDAWSDVPQRLAAMATDIYQYIHAKAAQRRS